MGNRLKESLYIILFPGYIEFLSQGPQFWNSYADDRIFISGRVQFFLKFLVFTVFKLKKYFLDFSHHCLHL